MFLKAEEHDLDSDEEQAYVLYMRYFNIISLMKKTKQYQENKVNLLFDSSYKLISKNS